MKPPYKEIVLAFLIGGLVGFFAATRSFERPRGDFHKGQLLEKFSRELSLTAEQKEKVAKIFEERKAQFEYARRYTKTEIEKVLTPEQIPAYRRMEAEWKAKRAKRPRPE